MRIGRGANRIWDAFWSDGISNPLEIIEQITYLLFLRRLDDLHTLEVNKSARLNRPMEHPVFPEGNDGIGKHGRRPYEYCNQLHTLRIPTSTECRRLR